MGCLQLLGRTALLAMVTVPMTTRAAEQRLVCPSSLNAQAVKIVQPPAGWTPFTPTTLQLHSAGPIGGPPAAMAELREYTSTQKKNVRTDVWHFSKDVPKEKWLSCGYGLGNEVTLSKKLDDDTTSCTVTFTKTKPYDDVVVGVLCK